MLFACGSFVFRGVQASVRGGRRFEGGRLGMASPRLLSVALGWGCRDLGYGGSMGMGNGIVSMQRPLAWDLPSRKWEGRTCTT